MADVYGHPEQQSADDIEDVAMRPGLQPEAAAGLLLNRIPMTAVSTAAPAAGAIGASEGVGAALAGLAAVAGRLAPAAAGAASAAAAALPFLLIPTNTQSETVDLGDDLRARIRPGQQSVEIERRSNSGLFGTGIMARWDTLPVDATLSVGEGGKASVLINRQQLGDGVGPEAATRARDAIASAMAPPMKEEDDSESPGSGAKADRAGEPDGGREPPNKPHIAISAAELGAKILDQAKRPLSEAESQEEITQTCRRVMRARGQQTPEKQYRGKDGFDTAVGVRMPSSLPDPTPGREFSPEHPYHRTGYVGELELANLVHAQGNQFVVHYGNAPGVQGPDVLSIGPDGLFNAWDSKSRSTDRSVGPSMASSALLDRQKVEEYVWREINSGRLPSELGLYALNQFLDGNYNVCTVGTGNAHDGFVEFVRGRNPSGPRRR